MLTNENSANSASKIMHALEHRKKRILEKSGKSVE
jgi:hypothetical protein